MKLRQTTVACTASGGVMKNSPKPSDLLEPTPKGVAVKTAAEPPSFAKALFHGKVLSEIIFPYPKSNPDEQQLLQMTVEAIAKLGKDLDVQRIEDEKCIPTEFLDKFREMGLFGLIIPEEYGGFGFSNTSYVQILSCLSMIDASITATIGAHQSIGLKALLMFGNETQKKTYLPKLATGEMIAAFGLTEPGAGSDAGSLKTKATLSEDGKHYLLNGSKIWITNGGIAQFYTVFARTEHRDADGKTKDKITAFIVTRDMKGFSTSPEEKKLGLVGSSTVALTFENVTVPVENVLGEPGKGFKVAMAVLNNGRLGLAGACALGSRKVMQLALEHALQRKQFGQPIAQFGLIQTKFANMAIDNYAAESMVRVAAYLMDSGIYDYSMESAMCKVFSTEAEWRNCNESLQIAGGTGFMKEYGYEKVLRDSRIFTIWEGANEILRLFIGLSGIQGPGETLREVAKALKQPMEDVLKSMGLLSDYGVRWIQRRIVASAQLEQVHPSLAREGAIFDKYTAALATTTENALRKHGKNIVKNQFVVKRIADFAIDLYAMACVLSRATSAINEKGVEKTQLDFQMARAFCRKARRRMAENIRRMEKNDDDLESTIANMIYEEGSFTTTGLFS